MTETAAHGSQVGVFAEFGDQKLPVLPVAHFNGKAILRLSENGYGA